MLLALCTALAAGPLLLPLPTPVPDAAKQALDAREIAQDTWSAALDTYVALQKSDPRRKDLPAHLSAITAANQRREAARWADASGTLDFVAMARFCETTVDPRCPAFLTTRQGLDDGLTALEARHTSTVGAFLQPLPAQAPIVLMHPDALVAEPAAQRVHRGYEPFCRPDELRAAGKAIVDPDALPAWLAAEGVTAEDARRTVDDLRAFVIGWVEGIELAGDGALAEHHVCIGLFDDVTGANSFAAGGAWLYVGLRDLQTMVGVHQAGIPNAVEYTVGHEYGHVLQQASGLEFPGPTAREGELHADCLAGYLMAVKAGPTFDSVGREYARTEVHRIGDHDTTNPQHHGTPEERQKAFDRGWSAGLLALQTGPKLRQSGGMLTACSLFAAAP